MELSLGFLFDAQVVLDAADGDAATSWVQVAKAGTFSDPRYGEFKITLADFRKWEANFENLVMKVGRVGLPADVDHSPEKTGDTEAVGWIKQLETRGQELWAFVAWNEKGKELIESKRYAYISPSYTAHFKDETGKDHGTALVGIALTNRPFLQMATVNLSKFTFAAPQNDGDEDDLIAPHILDISDTSRQKHAVVVKKVNGVTKHMFPIPPGDKLHASLALKFLPRAIAAGHITEQEAAAIKSRAHETLGTPDGSHQHAAYSHRQMELNAILTALNLSRETLGVATDADDATVLSALATHQAKPAVPDGHVVLSQDTVAKLTADATAGANAAEQLRVDKFDRTFLAMQQEGRVVLAQKDEFRELYDLNGEKVLAILAKLPKAVNMAPQGTGDEPADLDAEARTMLSGFQDVVTPMGVDMEAMRLHAAAVKLEVARKISYEQALQLAESGVTV